MKRIVLFVFSVLVATMFVRSANAQVVGPGGWSNALNRVMAGPNTERIGREIYGQYDYAINNGYYGYSQPSRIGTVIGGTIAGAAIGGLVGGNRGALIGAGVGGGATLLATSYQYQRSGRPLVGPSTVNRDNKRNGDENFVLVNQTRFAVEVWFGKGKGKYIGRLVSGETWTVKGPKPGEHYTGYALIPDSHGGISTDEVPIQPTENGWVFVEPNFQGRR